MLSKWNNEAVLDRETGLVWERQPVKARASWWSAMEACHGRLIAHRRGWHLPSFEELTSLFDDTQSNPARPAGHRFLGIDAQDLFWTATLAEQPAESFFNFVYRVEIGDAIITENQFEPRDDQLSSWCVRGGSATTNRHGFQ